MQDTKSLRSYVKRSKAIVIRYEDIVEDWEKFEKAITSRFRFKPNTLKLIYEKTRPRESENVNEHHRSGKWGQFKEHLAEETCGKLNSDFKFVLEKYGYER